MSEDRTRPVVGVPGVDFSVEDVRGSFPNEIEIKPLTHPVDATVRVPGSKSVTNRALVVAALAEGRSRILNPLFSDDSYWLMDALVRLGFEVRADREGEEVGILGLGGRVPRGDLDVFVGNAGTVARFLPRPWPWDGARTASTASPGCASARSATWWTRCAGSAQPFATPRRRAASP